jgi:cystathionine beta-lyase
MSAMLGSVNVLGYTAALAAFQTGEEWLDCLLTHLANNREILLQYINDHMPDIQLTKPEGTYLGWLNCKSLNLPLAAHLFFLKHARVAFNDGATFGPGGEGFVRLNFGCPTSMMIEGLERMRKAISTVV